RLRDGWGRERGVNAAPFVMKEDAGRLRRSARGEGPGLVHILPHLGDQGLDRVEALSAAEAGGEVDGGVGAVQVQVVAVEGVRLDRALARAERRVGADRDRGRPA